MIRSVSILIFVFLSHLTYGQISVAISADKDTINFGDEVQINYKINVPTGLEIDALDFNTLKELSNLVFEQYPENLDSLMDVDIIDGGVFKVDDNNLILSKDRLQGNIPLIGSIKLRVSSAGVMRLPKPNEVHSSGIQEMILTSPLLFVKSLGEMEDINPNWNIIEEEVSWRDYLIYIYIYLGFAVFLLGLYFIITYLRKGKKGFNVSKVEIVLPADEKALRDLNLLKEKELWQNGDTKGYHTELTRVMRQYIEDRYSVQALEMTSSQLKREMKLQEVDPVIAKRFDDILQIADKVKFAKGSTGPELNVAFMEEAFNIVVETKEVIIEKEEVK